MNDNTLSNKDVKKMKDNIQKEIQERREHAERLKKIALKLFEQLKSEKIDFRTRNTSSVCCRHP